MFLQVTDDGLDGGAPFELRRDAAHRSCRPCDGSVSARVPTSVTGVQVSFASTLKQSYRFSGANSLALAKVSYSVQSMNTSTTSEP